MRTSDIPYVPNVRTSYPVKKLEDMSLDEIKNKYIKTCGKANGLVSVCSKCPTPCREGKRAIQLVANQVYNDPPVPLFAGKTMIERAREENMARRQAKETPTLEELTAALTQQAEQRKAKESAPPKRISKLKRRNEVPFNGWYEVAMESGDPIKWLMNEMKISKTKANAKLYNYRWRNGLLDKKEPIQEKPIEEKLVCPDTANNFESKVDTLMKEREAVKKQMEEYQKLYKEAEKKYNAIGQNIDILCQAMDILNGS